MRTGCPREGPLALLTLGGVMRQDLEACSIDQRVVMEYLEDGQPTWKQMPRVRKSRLAMSLRGGYGQTRSSKVSILRAYHARPTDDSA